MKGLFEGVSLKNGKSYKLLSSMTDFKKNEKKLKILEIM